MAKFYSDEEITFLRENAPRFGAVICAQKLGRSVNSVRSKLSSLKVPSIISKDVTEEDIKSLNFKSSLRELDINFETTKTPKELAYFLGFFWADGYVREKDNNLLVEIVERDAEDLKPIFNRLATFSIYKRKREGRQVQITFRYKSKELVNFFKSLGKYSHSVESHEKILSYIPESYQLYFIRGFMDGDGSFYMGSKGATQLSIASSIEQDWEGLKTRLENYGLTLSVQKACTERGNSSHLRCTNSKLIRDFIKILYKIKDKIWLNRKYEKAMKIVEKE